MRFFKTLKSFEFDEGDIPHGKPGLRAVQRRHRAVKHHALQKGRKAHQGHTAALSFPKHKKQSFPKNSSKTAARGPATNLRSSALFLNGLFHLAAMLLFRALHGPCTRKYTTARPGVQGRSRAAAPPLYAYFTAALRKAGGRARPFRRIIKAERNGTGQCVANLPAARRRHVT